jgi:hypothetical protein
MFLDAEAHTTYRFANAPVCHYPFHHFYIQDVFPGDFYTEIIRHLPTHAELFPIEEKRSVKGYKERFVSCFDDPSLNLLSKERGDFWRAFRDVYLRGFFGTSLVNKFAALISKRFPGESPAFRDELLLVHDTKNYSLGPHTDSSRKVITVLFYLPVDRDHQALGTSIYVPNDPAFSCPGGPHHKHDRFRRIHTAPYLPNSALCFLKSDVSFHGVEQILEEGYGRWLLLYDIYLA